MKQIGEMGIGLRDGGLSSEQQALLEGIGRMIKVCGRLVNYIFLWANTHSESVY